MNMKLAKSTMFVAAAGVLPVLLVLCACSTAGYRKSDAVALSMKSAAAEVQAEGQQLEQSMGYLKKLMEEPEGDLKITFRQYSSALDLLKSSARRTEATGKRMAKRGAAYFNSWNKQLETIDYEHVREISATRRTEVTNRFAVIDQRYRESQAAVEPLITYLQDIRTALDSDLTTGGINALKSVAQNAETSADKVRTALQALTAELVNSSTTFASIGQAPSDTVKPPE